MLLRHRLEDGYADDVIAAASYDPSFENTKIIVLLANSAAASSEVRLLEIGADCVQRDPIRADVVMAYIAKYIRHSTSSATSRSSVPADCINFAGARLDSLERTLRSRESSVQLTPREVTLVEILAESAGKILTYETLYSDVLGRRYRGDTSNMRVLLGKLGSSLKSVGVSLQDHVDVIAKTGYRYRSPQPQGRANATTS